MDPSDSGGPPGGRGSDGDGGSRRRRALWRMAASVGFGARGYGGSRPKLSVGVHSREGGRAPSEESGEGEALVVPEWPGQWRRKESPERKKTTPLVFLLLWVGQ